MPHRTRDAKDHGPHGGDRVLSPWGTVRAVSPQGNGECQGPGPCGMGHALRVTWDIENCVPVGREVPKAMSRGVMWNTKGCVQ